jgi:hypothetical protein
MPNYLLSVYQPEGPTPPQDQLDAIMAEVDKDNKEIQAAGAWVFAGGLDYPSTATVVSSANGSEPLLTDGPYVELKEYLGGLTILRAEDLDAALGWARRIHQATGLPIEVRPFFNEYT